MHSTIKGICQIKLFRGKNGIMEDRVNNWIRDFNICNPGKECKIREISFVPNGTRNESDVMIIYDLIDCCDPEGEET